jgi:hypothetical protein
MRLHVNTCGGGDQGHRKRFCVCEVPGELFYLFTRHCKPLQKRLNQSPIQYNRILLLLQKSNASVAVTTKYAIGAVAVFWLEKPLCQVTEVVLW